MFGLVWTYFDGFGVFGSMFWEFHVSRTIWFDFVSKESRFYDAVDGCEIHFAPLHHPIYNFWNDSFVTKQWLPIISKWWRMSFTVWLVFLKINRPLMFVRLGVKGGQEMSEEPDPLCSFR